MKKTLTLFVATIFSQLASAQINWMATFESHSLMQLDTFYNGSDSAGSFNSGKATYINNYNPAWQSWDGVSVSNMKDTTTPGYGNQYSVISGSGVNYSSNYAVAHKQTTVVLHNQQVVKGMYVNNGTYPTLSMRDGDQFAKKFGGNDGNDPDFLRIIATGHIGNSTTTDMFYLADYRFSDNSKDYLVKDWTHWNLERLGDVDSIVFTMESSDTGQFGMNTPAYFCFDNFNSDSLTNSYIISDIDFDYNTNVDSFLSGSQFDGGFVQNTVLFENKFNKQWGSWTGWSVSSMSDTVDATFNNQYSCISGSGFGKSKTYLTGYQRASMHFPYVSTVHFQPTAAREFKVGINNSTYGFKTMQDGNQFAKKFGGVSGSDKDYLVVKVVGVLYNGETTDTLSHYLADYRSDDNSKDYIQKDWSYWNLTDIMYNQAVVSLHFWVEGSDTGQFGLNTPAYFCMDNIFPMTGAVQHANEMDLTIFPNPTNEVINVMTSNDITRMTVFDITGETHSTHTQNSKSVNVSDLKTGIYFIEVRTTKGVSVKQFIKQ